MYLRRLVHALLGVRAAARAIQLVYIHYSIRYTTYIYIPAGWYTPRWEYVQPFEARPASGCDVAASTCADFHARYPGYYYCSAPGLATKGAVRPCFSSNAQVGGGTLGLAV